MNNKSMQAVLKIEELKNRIDKLINQVDSELAVAELVIKSAANNLNSSIEIYNRNHTDQIERAEIGGES